jgi:DNA-binding beta-propeller fold protein YncE
MIPVLPERRVPNMHRRTRQLIYALVAVSLVLPMQSPPLWGNPDGEFKAYVLDAEKKTVESIVLPAGTISGSVNLEKTPTLMAFSPDGSRLLVFEYDEKERLAERRQKGLPIARFGKPNSLSIFNTRDMKQVARIDNIGWNAVAHPYLLWPRAEINAMWDSSGRLMTMLAWGVKDKNPEIVQLDIVKGAIAGRRPIPCKPGEVDPIIRISGDRAAVLYGKRAPDNKAGSNHSLILINLANLADSKEISLPGVPREMAASADGDHVYVLADDGNKIKDPGQAHLHIVSATQHSLVQSIDGGYSLIDVLTDTATGLTLVSRIGKSGTSTLFAFQQDSKKAEIEIPDVIMQATLAPKTRRLYLVCYDSVQVIDLVTLKLVGSIATPHRTRGFWESGSKERPPSTLAFNSRENVAVLGYAGDDESSVLDLENFKVKGMIDITSGLRAFGTIMAVAMVTGAIAGAGSAFAGVPVAPAVMPQGPAIQYATSIVDPSDQHVYMMMMARVYVADLKTFKQIAAIRLPFNSHYGFMPPTVPGQKPLLYVVGSHIGFTSKASYRMEVVDLTTNEQLRDQKWLAHSLYTPDRKYAINFDLDNVYLLDGATLSTIKTIGGMKEPRQILLAPPADTGEK